MRSPADAAAFRTLNEAWIGPLFGFEPVDRATLDDPQAAIVAPGGDVLMAVDGERAVGCVALLPEGGGVYELTKMAVAESERSRGIGRLLVEAAIARARERGARELVLASNSRLATALALYESVGFRHVPPTETAYARADVFMTLAL